MGLVKHILCEKKDGIPTLDHSKSVHQRPPLLGPLARPVPATWAKALRPQSFPDQTHGVAQGVGPRLLSGAPPLFPGCRAQRSERNFSRGGLGPPSLPLPPPLSGDVRSVLPISKTIGLSHDGADRQQWLAQSVGES